MSDRRAIVGAYLPQISATFEPVLHNALRCEALGFDTLWLYDHLYTPFFPKQPALEGWTLATALLARTSTLRVGHLVLNNNLRHPALLGKMVTTLDVISGGRFEFGLGSGSYEGEHHQAGLPFGTWSERTSRLEESIRIVFSMLENEVTSFEGDHFTLSRVPNVPGPVSSPRPPLHIGGVGPRFTMPLVARYADVWNVPVYGLEGWQETAALLDRLCDDIGRDPSTIRRSHQAVLVLGADDAAVAAARTEADRHYAGYGIDAGGYVGRPEQVLDRMGQQIDAGCTEFAFIPADRGRGEMLELFAAEVLPHLP